MKKIFSLLFVVVMASSVVAQTQSGESTLTGKKDEQGGVIALAPSQTVTDADNGKTITLHVGEGLVVCLPSKRHFVFGDKQYGSEALSIITFDRLSNEGILTVNAALCLGRSRRQNDKSFIAAAPGQTTLSYKRLTSYIGYGSCPTPECIEEETISFNIVVTE